MSLNYNIKDIKNLPEEIKDVWSWEDVRSRDESLTEIECKQVLVIVDGNRDAEIGINWDVIDNAIDELPEYLEEK